LPPTTEINPKPVLLLNHFTRPVRRTGADVTEELALLIVIADTIIYVMALSIFDCLLFIVYCLVYDY
jgi:hypothetical protein